MRFGRFLMVGFGLTLLAREYVLMLPPKDPLKG